MNDTMDLKERFENSQPGYVTRISTDHVLDLYIGMNEQGQKMIEYRGKFHPRKIIGTSAIDVSQLKGDGINTLRFTLVCEEVSSLFYIFCQDIADHTKNLFTPTSGYTEIINRYYEWKQLFVSPKKKRLTESQIMGLIGELLYLRDGIGQRIGLHDALHSWSGQEMTRKDFSFNDNWYEVKAVTRGKPTVHISSIEQLDSDDDGQLIIFPMEKMSEEYNGVKLNELIIAIRELFDNADDREMFDDKVAMQGYEYSTYYDDFVYAVDRMRIYNVTSEFPRIRRNQLSQSITSCSYELLIKDIEIFAVKE